MALGNPGPPTSKASSPAGADIPLFLPLPEKSENLPLNQLCLPLTCTEIIALHFPANSIFLKWRLYLHLFKKM
jgi:hypothetical protein